MTTALDATRAVLDEANRAHGTDFTLLDAIDGGFQSGAWRVVDGAGRNAVLKWAENTGTWAEVVLAAAPKVAAARAAGYPTPAWLACGRTAEGYPYEVQAAVDGRPAPGLTVPLARQLVDVLERCAAGRAPERGSDPRAGSWSEFVAGEMFGDARDGLRPTVAALGAEAAAAVRGFDALWAAHGPIVLPEGDLVHGDLNLGNVLVDGAGRLVGIVDIEALGGGSRAVDYATLWAAADEGAGEAAAGAAELVREAAVRAVGAGPFALCVGWNALELVRFVAGRDGAEADGTREKVRTAVRRRGLAAGWLAEARV